VVLPEETVELPFRALHIFKDELLQPLIAKFQSFFFDGVQVIDADHREGESPILLLQVLLGVLLDLLNEQLALFPAVSGEIDISNEVLDDFVAVLLEVSDLLRVDLELPDVLVESREVLAGALEAKALVMVGKGIPHLLNVVFVGQKMDEFLIDDQ
jgi:hypothetical protein